MTPFIVAEISKSYVDGTPVGTPEPISVLFERVIETNRQKGYRLNNFQVHRLYRSILDQMPGTKSGRVLQQRVGLEETIIAVFEVMQ